MQEHPRAEPHSAHDVASLVDDVQQHPIQARPHALTGQPSADADLSTGEVHAAVRVDQPVDLDRWRQLRLDRR